MTDKITEIMANAAKVDIGQQFNAEQLHDHETDWVATGGTIDLSRTMQTAITALEQAGYQIDSKDKWQPIETAPKDGTRILVWDDDTIETAYWAIFRSRWEHAWDGAELGAFEITHWMPLPEPPQ